MEVFNLGNMEAVLLLGAVAGVVELVKRIFAKDIKAVATIAGAGVTGVVAALLLAINPLIGLVVGFSASGYITLAQNVGK